MKVFIGVSQKQLFLRLSLAGPFLGPFPISTDPNTKIVRHGHHSHPVLECMHLVIVYILHIVQYAGKFVKSEEEWQSHAPYFRTCETDDVEEVHLDFWMPPYFSNTVDVFLKYFWCISQTLLMCFSNTFDVFLKHFWTRIGFLWKPRFQLDITLVTFHCH